MPFRSRLIPKSMLYEGRAKVHTNALCSRKKPNNGPATQQKNKNSPLCVTGYWICNRSRVTVYVCTVRNVVRTSIGMRSVTYLLQGGLYSAMASR